MNDTELTHHGSRSKRRLTTKCGLAANYDRDSTRYYEVTCLNCVKMLLADGRMANYEAWKEREKFLEIYYSQK